MELMFDTLRAARPSLTVEHQLHQATPRLNVISSLELVNENSVSNVHRKRGVCCIYDARP
ncbi:hypothetical protein BHAP_0165 [Bifidobacterium hapali]|uniref:Uncharacterized protein n=1 Tax=Bifidobacterium hapali TaxID=1630172 RepID=A0A261G519_9BIFI|nr:hypothetical protein BHAP_0165 [Bifidobacterium hapali]